MFVHGFPAGINSPFGRRKVLEVRFFMKTSVFFTKLKLLYLASSCPCPRSLSNQFHRIYSVHHPSIADTSLMPFLEPPSHPSPIHLPQHHPRQSVARVLVPYHMSARSLQLSIFRRSSDIPLAFRVSFPPRDLFLNCLCSICLEVMSPLFFFLMNFSFGKSQYRTCIILVQSSVVVYFR